METIRVKSLRRTVQVTIELQALPQALLHLLKAKHACMVESQLYFAGKELAGERTLEAQGVCSGSVLLLVALPISVYRVQYQTSTFTFSRIHEESVQELLTRVATSLSVDPKRFYLATHGKRICSSAYFHYKTPLELVPLEAFTAQPVRIHVQSQIGCSTRLIDCWDSDPVEHLQRSFEIGRPCRAFFQGRMLDPYMSLHEAGVRDDSQVYIVYRFHG